METLIHLVKEQLNKAAYAAFREIPLEHLDMDITPATQEKFGHYQCNSAMKLSRVMKKNPREIAEAIIDHLEDEIFSNVELAGPGFINLTLNENYLSSVLERIIKDPRLGFSKPLYPKRIIVEFSSPNIAKEMHVGHLRSTIIGDALARLFEFLGHKVIRLNHVGDWGTAFGMLIAYLQQERPQVLSGEEAADLPALMAWYKESKALFDKDEIFKGKARAAVVSLQRGNPEALKAWETICHISRVAFQEVYDLLDIHLQERGESYYNPMLAQVVEDLDNKGLIVVSEGAKCIFHEGFRIPLMVQKSDGGYNYDTTDMAAMLDRVRGGAERIIIVTDAGQSLHFDLIRKTAEKAGYLDPKKVRFDHVPFGVVLGADGKKFRTRSGETEKLIDLLTTAIQEAKKILLDRDPNLSPKEVDSLAKILGIDAVKYADLSCNRISDYVFSYERMLRFEGNTAAFILYSFVRINGIKKKVGKIDLGHTRLHLQHPAEIQLGLHLIRFSEILALMQEELLPNLLTEYLYELAQKFNIFFRDCRVEGDAAQSSRLLLCEGVTKTMETGLSILGIKTVSKM